MEMKAKDLCRTAFVAALYVALTTLNPLSWGAVQLRVANILCAAPLFKKSYAPAVLLGIGIANAMSPFGPVDVLFGLAAEGVAYALVVWGPLKWLPAALKAFVPSQVAPGGAQSLCALAVCGAGDRCGAGSDDRRTSLGGLPGVVRRNIYSC